MIYFLNLEMKKTIIRLIIIFVSIWFIRTFIAWKPTIYKEIDHNTTQLLNSIEHLKEATRTERRIALSNSIAAKLIKKISNKINILNYDYYYVIDYCIDHYQKESMLSVMTLNEWYEFKQNRDNWDVLAWGSIPLSPYVSQDYMIEQLERLETEILKTQ